MVVNLFDTPADHYNLQPFTFTRPVSLIRIGIMTIHEKWAKALGVQPGFKTPEYLSKKYPALKGETVVWVNGSVCPDPFLAAEIKVLPLGAVLRMNDVLIAVHAPGTWDFSEKDLRQFQRIEIDHAGLFKISYPWDIFTQNGRAIADDFKVITAGRESAPVPTSNQVINPGAVFIEPGARVECSVINASTGPVYIGKDAEIMEGSLIRGPFALCDHASTKMGAKIYGPTTIGPHSKVGGEVNNSVIFGFSNKAHDGFIGNTVIGEWCNLGADTNTSNLKNNYSEVAVFNYMLNEPMLTGTQFCGLFMGDHSKCGINTMFNTGTVVGAFANIFDGDFPPKHVPSFAWGGAKGFEKFRFDKAVEVATRVFDRRGVKMTPEDIEIFRFLFENTAI